jgi:hypothetical protein
MRIVPKSCAGRIFALIFIVGLIYFLAGNWLLQSFHSILVAEDKIQGQYDAAVIECWTKPQSTMIKIADSLFQKKLVKDIYITHFKYEPGKFYAGGEVPKYIDKIINLYIYEYSPDTSLFKKIPIEPKDPITFNLASQVFQHLKSKGYKRIILISESYHSYRSKLAFEKAFENSGVQIATIPAELGITKETWWNTDSGLSTTFSEFIKLIYYRLFVL